MSRDLRCLVACACMALTTALFVYPPKARAEQAIGREVLTEDAAVALVREKTDGKVIRVDRRTEGDRVFYRVRVLTPDGRLREYKVDAATGALR